jgi:hypothetical protein
MRFWTCCVLSWILFSGLTHSKNADPIRDAYRKALKEESSVKELKSLTKLRQNALSTAFYAMALALEARDASWVPSKMSLAKEAFTELNKAVKLDPNNFEIRYLRFSFSCEVPGMLGMNAHIQEDKTYLLKHAHKGESLADVMKKYFQKSSCLNASEKTQINSRL